jgi:hypothetical protein
VNSARPLELVHRAEVVGVRDESSASQRQPERHFLSLEFFPMIGYTVIRRPRSVGRSFGRPQRKCRDDQRTCASARRSMARPAGNVGQRPFVGGSTTCARSERTQQLKIANESSGANGPGSANAPPERTNAAGARIRGANESRERRKPNEPSEAKEPDGARIRTNLAARESKRTQRIKQT